MLIDTHCHLDFSEFNSDRESVLRRSEEEGVGYIINVGSSLENSRAAVKISKECFSVFASVGIHPHDAKDFSEDAFGQIDELAANDKVVAIGEVGLDFYRDISDRKIQEDVFRKFIKLAETRHLPLIIHCRQAQEDLLRILKEERYSGMRGVVHCFSGNANFLKDCLDLGLFISYTCNVTYKKSDDLKDLVKVTPLDRLMLETDAPYLSPEGFRGKRNEPMHVKILAEAVSKIKKISFDDVAETTTHNAKELFGLNI